MKLCHKLCALVCAVLLTCTAAGCVAQPNMAVPDPTPKPVATTPTPSATPAAPVVTTATLVQAAEEELAKGEKKAALSLIAQAIQLEADRIAKEELQELWWNAMADVTDVPKETLTEDELRALSAVAYLASFTDCFLDARELTKEQRLTPLEIYYGMSMTMPLYSRPGWDTFPFRGAYPPDGETGEGACYLSVEKANEFVKQLLGIDIPDAEAEGEFRDGIACKDGTYTVDQQDILMSDFLVSGYRYIGDDLFYVDFDWDTYANPDPNKAIVIFRDSRKLIVRRSSSAWGFNVVSKLQEKDERIISEEFDRPEGMTYFINRSAKFYNDPQAVNTRATKWLEEKIKKDVQRQEFSRKEIDQLNELASLVYVAPYYLDVAELDLIPMCTYYQRAFRYHYETDQYELKEGLFYPADGLRQEQKGIFSIDSVVVSEKQAAALMKDMMGIKIPHNGSDYGDAIEDYVYYQDGNYYVYQNDLEIPIYLLSAYQYLGDNTFYLSFAVDDRWMGNGSFSATGVILDDCRLVVKRSNSEWGFTVLSKLKSGDQIILPDDFPQPRFPAPYELSEELERILQERYGSIA